MKKISLLLCAIFIIVACEKETELTKHTLTISTNDAEGTVEPSEMSSYFEGDVVQVMATPKLGYKFKNWTGVTNPTKYVLDKDGDPTNVATSTITMDAAKTVVASFEKVLYNLNITTVGQGSVAQVVVKTGSASYTMNSEIKLTANAASGWIFDKWTGDVTGSDNPKNITMGAAEKSITAVFKLDVQLTASTDGSGSVTKQLVSGKTYTVTATADAGSVFDKWTGGATGTDNPINITLSESTTVIAVFKNNAPISRSADGKTLVAKVGTGVGTEVVFEGETYTVLDNAKLLEWVTASAGGAYSGDLAGTPASEAKDLTKAITTFCTDMKELFKDKTTFNADISTWDVSNVTTMEGMFEGAEKFNKDVSKWDTNKVQNMDKMFKNATEFKQDLSKWCVVNLTTEPTEFTVNSGFDEQEKPVWGTWPENPFIGKWVLDSYTVYVSDGINILAQDKSIWDPYLQKLDTATDTIKQYMICEDIELVQMEVIYAGTVGKYERKKQKCNLDGSKLELKTEQGYWIYDTENKAIYADEALTDIKNPDNRIDAEYTSDKKYFYAGMWDVMDYGPQAGLEVYIVEVYKRVL